MIKAGGFKIKSVDKQQFYQLGKNSNLEGKLAQEKMEAYIPKQFNQKKCFYMTVMIPLMMPRIEMMPRTKAMAFTPDFCRQRFKTFSSPSKLRRNKLECLSKGIFVQVTPAKSLSLRCEAIFHSRGIVRITLFSLVPSKSQ